MQDLPGELGLDVGQGQRAHADAAVADLVPVMAHPGPTAVSAIKPQRGLRPFSTIACCKVARCSGVHTS